MSSYPKTLENVVLKQAIVLNRRGLSVKQSLAELLTVFDIGYYLTEQEGTVF